MTMRAGVPREIITKAEIRRIGETWCIVKPDFGFRAQPEVIKCKSFKDAVSKLYPRTGSSSQHVDRTSTPEPWNYRWGPRWPLIIR